MTETLLELVHNWEGLGLFGLAGLTVLFVLGGLVYVPRFALCITGGLIFGFATAPVALVGSTLGSVAAFLIARHALGGRFERWIGRRPRWQATRMAVDAEGWRLVFLLRLATPLPAPAVSYMLGLTGIGTVPFAAATCAGLVPTVIIFVSLGAVGRMGLQDVANSWASGAFLVAGIGAFVTVATLVGWRIRRRLALMALESRTLPSP